MNWNALVDADDPTDAAHAHFADLCRSERARAIWQATAARIRRIDVVDPRKITKPGRWPKRPTADDYLRLRTAGAAEGGRIPKRDVLRLHFETPDGGWAFWLCGSPLKGAALERVPPLLQPVLGLHNGFVHASEKYADLSSVLIDYVPPRAKNLEWVVRPSMGWSELDDLQDTVTLRTGTTLRLVEAPDSPTGCVLGQSARDSKGFDPDAVGAADIAPFDAFVSAAGFEIAVDGDRSRDTEGWFRHIAD